MNSCAIRVAVQCRPRRHFLRSMSPATEHAKLVYRAVPRLLCIGQLEIMATDGIAPSCPPQNHIKSPLSRKSRARQYRRSSNEIEQQELEDDVFQDRSLMNKKKGERSMYTEKFFVIVPASGDVPRLVCEREGAA